ncbi:MAG: chemotaxis protein CheW [Sporolactobacillus sp.]
MSEHHAEQILLSFFAAKKQMGLSIFAVDEIIEPVNPVRVPVTDDVFEGVIALRGRMLPLINLSKLLGEAQRSAEQFDEKYLIITDQELTAALHVDAIGETFSCTDQSLTDLANQTAEQLFSVQYTNASTHFPLLDIKQLFAKIKQRNEQVRQQAGYMAIS